MAVRKNKSAQPRPRTGAIYNFMGSLVLGGSLVLTAVLWLEDPRQVSAAPVPTAIVAEYDTIPVPVPVRTILSGTRLGDAEFKMLPYPRHQLPEGALLEVAELKDFVAAAALPANLPIFPENLNRRAPGSNAVVDRIPENMRAITVRTDATTVVEGWAGSGSIVDVLLIEQDRTIVIAEQVQILSAERSIQPIADQQSPEVPTTVTLLVTQDQALAINTALPRGRLSFALRSQNDQQNWKRPVYTSDNFRKAGGAADQSKSISGYITMADGQAFALANGQWIRTEVKPQGFLVNQKDSEHAKE